MKISQRFLAKQNLRNRPPTNVISKLQIAAAVQLTQEGSEGNQNHFRRSVKFWRENNLIRQRWRTLWWSKRKKSIWKYRSLLSLHCYFLKVNSLFYAKKHEYIVKESQKSIWAEETTEEISDLTRSVEV